MGECLLARHGGTRYVVGSYVGNGKCGVGNHTRITSNFKFNVCIIMASLRAPHCFARTIMIRPLNYASPPDEGFAGLNVIWGDNYVEYWHDQSNRQFNNSGVTYGYLLM